MAKKKTRRVRVSFVCHWGKFVVSGRNPVYAPMGRRARIPKFVLQSFALLLRPRLFEKRRTKNF